MNKDVGGEWDGATLTVIPDGYWPLEVSGGKVTTSKAGNRMIEADVTVLGTQYAGSTIRHWLVFTGETDPENFNVKKRRWFQESCGVAFTLGDDPVTVGRQLIHKRFVGKSRKRTTDQGKEVSELVGCHDPSWTPEDGKWGDGSAVEGGLVPTQEAVDLEEDIDLEEDEDFMAD